MLEIVAQSKVEKVAYNIVLALHTLFDLVEGISYRFSLRKQFRAASLFKYG